MRRQIVAAAMMAGIAGAPSAAAQALSRADSSLLWRVLGAEDRRDSSDRALQSALRDPDPRLSGIAWRALHRIADPKFADRDSLPRAVAPEPVVAWPEPAWRARFRDLTAARSDCAALERGVADSAWPVRLRAADLAGPSCVADTALTRVLRGWMDDMPRDVSRHGASGVSWHAAAHATVALARIGTSDAAARAHRMAAHAEWHLRLYAARAAALVKDTTLLVTLADDANDNVREAAIEALSALVSHARDDLYLAALHAGGPQAVRAAATALAGSPRRDVPDSANAAYTRWRARDNDSERDARLALLAAAGRSAAADQPSPQREPVPPDAVSLALGRDVRLRVTMSAASGGGAFVVRLRGDVAPIMAARVLALARAGYYDGGHWHRVEPDFVIQGAGPGTSEYVGYRRYFRDELGTLAHERGTVGMSTRGHDTGDAQWFVNLRDNPRLTADYTVFGDVVEGMEVVDRILEGDVIATVREETSAAAGRR